MEYGIAPHIRKGNFQPTPMIIGLTGGLGCGKSTTAKIIAAHGFKSMDSDVVVRDLLLPNPEVISAIQRRFGPDVLDSAGQVDRARLAAKVFSDDAALLWLEHLLHPKLFDHWRATFDRERNQRWVVEVPLLFEKSLQNWFDFTVCVASHSASQFARLVQRGLAPTLVRQRIARQLPIARKIELSDAVLLNDGSLCFLREQVALLVRSVPSGS
jgi:dephospho-CoA kinase